MTMGRWRYNPILIIRQSAPPTRVTDSDWSVVREKNECTVESPILGLGLGLRLGVGLDIDDGKTCPLGIELG